MVFRNNIYLLLSLICLSSCESALEKQQRLELKEQHKIENREIREKAAKEKAFQLELERSERKRKSEIERKEKAIYNKYINNSLNTGDMPYAYCYGRNKSCSDWGCSKISVKTPYNSDVLVIIKKNSEVYRHAYINSGTTYTFEFPNGVYQAFFYYGKGWNPNKTMKQTNCGTLKGGFVENESYSKDSPQNIKNSVLSYELILQENGNFKTKPSNSEEAF